MTNVSAFESKVKVKYIQIFFVDSLDFLMEGVKVMFGKTKFLLCVDEIVDMTF